MLKPGHYLLRHEIINIEANLQFFPECAQVEVTGDGDQFLGEEYLVEFPDAYKPKDPGIYIVGKIYTNLGWGSFNYTMSGLRVWGPEDK